MSSYEKSDFWTKKAFKEGYPARSVYKLKEMNEKFSLFSKKSTILDLGAAPGSWTVFVLRELEETGKLVAVDLKPLSSNVKGNNLTFFQGDLNDAEIRTTVKNLGPYNAVLCDAAPATTGNKLIDTTRSAQLVEMAMYYAKTMLVQGGNCAIKIFQGGDQQGLMKQMREIFTTARTFKPVACRSESFETYFIGLNKK